MASTLIDLGDFAADVVRKDIKNVHLSVYPPTGRVRISAPRRMRLDTIRVFAISKLDWIKRQQASLRAHERESPRAMIDLESVYVWGTRYRVDVQEASQPAHVELAHGRIVLACRPGKTEIERRGELDRCYRAQIRERVPALLTKWEPDLGVQTDRFFVQRMKTRWGSCSPSRKSIRLNSELAKKPIECLELVVIHELAHLIERTHNERFVALMDRHLPDWPHRRNTLNSLPVRGVDWKL